MGAVDGKVAFVTGAARGLGRSHAVTLAREGADIIGLDLCDQIATVDYPMSTDGDLAETVRQVQAVGRRMVAFRGDVRRLADVTAAIDAGVAEFGRLDIVIANAGIGAAHGSTEDPEQVWGDVIDVNLTGTFNTVTAARQPLIEGGRGGSIVLTSSTAGLKGSAASSPGGLGYIASKHAVVGIMRALANDLGPHGIRVNTVHPTITATPLVENDAMREWSAKSASGAQHVLPVKMIEPADVSSAVLWLVADTGRYVTGIMLPVDAGFSVK